MLIYKITNLANGKVYVGQTTQSLSARWHGHIYEATRSGRNVCTLLDRAIRKYGADRFSVETLEECDSMERLDKCEESWISRLQTQDRLVGYNIAPGGNRNRVSPEGKQRLRIAMLGKRLNQLQLDTLRKTRSTPEHRAKMRKSQTAYARPVMCKETGEIFPSINVAAEHFRVFPASISNSMRDRKQHARGLTFVDTEQRPSILYKSWKRPVLCTETRQVFSSMRDAALRTGIDRKTISNILKGLYKHPSFNFSYTEAV